MNDWIGALVAVTAGIVVGIFASRLVMRVLSRSKVEALKESASPLAGLALSTFAIVGLLVALGFIAPDELDQLGSDAIAFLPKLIAALIILIGANVASRFAATAVARALSGTGSAARFAPMITRYAILGGGAIIAAGQTGIDTAVVNIAVAALLFGVALSLSLLIGLGGRQVASELAAGRAWRDGLRRGDRVRAAIRGASVAGASGDAIVEGTIVDLHPTSVEIDSVGTTLFVPNSRLLESVVERDRPEPPRRVAPSGELDV